MALEGCRRKLKEYIELFFAIPKLLRDTDVTILAKQSTFVGCNQIN
jgi:hypothetical protein